MKKVYDRAFYKQRQQEMAHTMTVHAAQVILSTILNSLPPIHSAVDFGCGIGTWLSVLKGMGVADVLGLDGDWVDQDLLEIPEKEFRKADFEQKVKLDKKYDIAISLETAEHITEEHACSFIDSLVSVSDFILFSAAIPFQGGVHHVNEQWPDYWAAMFKERNYITLDFVRGAIWNDANIPFWYRQNTLLFVKKEQMQNVKLPISYSSPLSLVHPEVCLMWVTIVKELLYRMTKVEEEL